jgi:hypothetical protein
MIMIIKLNHGLAYYQFSEYNTSEKIKRKKKKKRFAKIYNAFDNHVGGDSVVRVWDQEICFSVVSGSSHVVAHMMATGGLHGR